MCLLQGVENKRCYELNEEEINKIREEVGKYTTEADLVRQGATNLVRQHSNGVGMGMAVLRTQARDTMHYCMHCRGCRSWCPMELQCWQWWWWHRYL